MVEQLLVQFGDVEPFWQHEEIGSPATVSKLKGIFSDSSKKVYLKVELASVVDYGKPFVTATYILDSPNSPNVSKKFRLQFVQAIHLM